MIKNILPLKDDKKRQLIIFDDDSTVCILNTAVKEYNLSAGNQISVEKATEIADAAEEMFAFGKAVDALGRCQKSQKEMRLYLKEKGFKWDIAVKVVDKLIGYGYLDDNTYIEAYVSHYGKSTGRRKLIYDLSTEKGLDSKFAENYVSEVFDEEAEIEKAVNLLTIFIKRNKKTDNLKQKAYGHLRNKGFEGDIASSALDIIFNKD